MRRREGIGGDVDWGGLVDGVGLGLLRSVLG